MQSDADDKTAWLSARANLLLLLLGWHGAICQIKPIYLGGLSCVTRLRDASLPSVPECVVGFATSLPSASASAKSTVGGLAGAD